MQNTDQNGVPFIIVEQYIYTDIEISTLKDRIGRQLLLIWWSQCKYLVFDFKCLSSNFFN